MKGIKQDVIARTRAEGDVPVSQMRLRAVLDGMSIFVGLFSMDGVLLEANEALLRLVDVRREDVIGTMFAEGRWWGHSPEMRDRVRTMLRRAASDEIVRQDLTVLDQDGRTIALDAVFAPLRDEQGAVVQIVGSGVDVSERKRAEESLVESRGRLEELTRRLLEAQESERRSIARELHDEVGGVLTAVRLNLQSLRGKPAGGPSEAALADGMTLVDGAIQAVRSLSLELRPAVLDDLGLVPALRWYCGRQAQRAGVSIELSLDAIDLKPALLLESTCYRIVQESVANALRHANAWRIQVALRRSDGSFVLEIADDGVGFDVAAARERCLAGESSGLLGMEERASLLGGRLSIDSAPGAGTRIRAEFAVPEGGFA